MALDNDNKNNDLGELNEDGSTKKSDLEISIEEKLKGFESKLDLSQERETMLNKLLADSSVQDIIKLRAEGKEPVVSDVENPESNNVVNDPGESTGDDIDMMTNKEFLNHITKSITGTIEKRVTDLVQPLQNEMQATKQEREQTEFNASLSRTKKKYGESFDSYSKEMLEQNSRIQKDGISVEDLYKISRYDDLESEARNAFATSERPTHLIERPIRSDGAKTRQGRKGFSDMIFEALDKNI